MTLFEIILIGISLGSDAFMVSICKGLNYHNKRKESLITSFSFGFFQTIMPILGYYLGNIFTEKIIYYNPYISTILLIIIGILIYRNNDTNYAEKINTKELLLLSIATSIDALVIGISFSFLKLSIILNSLIIGIITFIMCYIGFNLGHLFQKKLGKYAYKIAGIILILLGIKIFISHLLQ